MFLHVQLEVADLEPDILTSLVEFERIYGGRGRLVWAGAVFALVYLGWILCLCRSQAGTVPVDPESSKTL